MHAREPNRFPQLPVTVARIPECHQASIYKSLRHRKMSHVEGSG